MTVLQEIHTFDDRDRIRFALVMRSYKASGLVDRTVMAEFDPVTTPSYEFAKSFGFVGPFVYMPSFRAHTSEYKFKLGYFAPKNEVSRE